MKVPVAYPLVLALLAGVPAVSAAQPAAPAEAPAGAEEDVAAEAPPHVLRLDGSEATRSREAVVDPLDVGDPVLFGDRVDTGQAFVQMLWGDGTRVALDKDARLDVLAADALGVAAGRAVIVRPAGATASLRLDTPAAPVQLGADGEYRVSIDGPTTTMVVVRGRATVDAGAQERVVEAGQQIALREGVTPGTATAFNAAGRDSFVEWANRSPASPATGAPLETFQDPRFEAYTDVFNSSGTWETDPRLGAVWYPAVGPDWRPYGDGYWQPYGPANQWLWVGQERWGWPTHHFGQWDVNATGRWFWQPGRQWAPSRVTWSVGPGYIGWSPLGSQTRSTWNWDRVSQPRSAYAAAGFDPVRAWTVIPSDQFGRRGRVGTYAVDPRTLANTSAFVTQRATRPAVGARLWLPDTWRPAVPAAPPCTVGRILRWNRRTGSSTTEEPRAARPRSPAARLRSDAATGRSVRARPACGRSPRPPAGSATTAAGRVHREAGSEAAAVVRDRVQSVRLRQGLKPLASSRPVGMRPDVRFGMEARGVNPWHTRARSPATLLR